jgi:predicted Zn-dependent protease
MNLCARIAQRGYQGLLIAALLGSNACTGENMLSPAEEASLGRAEFPRTLAQYGGVYNDARLAAWLNGIRRRLADRSGAPTIHFTVTVLDTGGINAFSTPGGYVYVTRGLLAAANSEAEVAAALGHEMGHLIAHHQAARYRNERRGLGDALLSVWSGSADLSGLIDAGTDERLMQFSRNQEFEADRLGIGILSSAGYDPGAMAAFLRTVKRDTALRERIAGMATDRLRPNFLDMHPLTADRIAQAEAEADKFPKVIGGDRGRAAYFRAIDGMAYGDSPAQGYVRGRRFVHVQAGFAFDAPPGFTLFNSPSAVVGARDDGAALILTSAIPNAAASPLDYLVRSWGRGIDLPNVQPITIGGRPGATAVFRTVSDRGPVDVRLVAIGWSPSLVYRLIFITPQGVSDAQAELEMSMNSFHAPAAPRRRRFGRGGFESSSRNAAIASPNLRPIWRRNIFARIVSVS